MRARNISAAGLVVWSYIVLCFAAEHVDGVTMSNGCRVLAVLQHSSSARSGSAHGKHKLWQQGHVV
jgi:hypothetical protein